MKLLKLTFFLLFTSQIYLFAQVPNDDRILLQGFHWESHEAAANGWYNHIKSQANELGDAGFDMVWLPPPSNAASDEGYLPRELNNMNNHYGTAAEHAAMINELHNNDIEAIADIVINHRVGCTNWMDFCNPAWGSWSITADDEVWSQPAFNNVYPRGNYDTGTSYGPARDVDHTNQGVQQGISTWMNDVLKGIGYDGWRYDFVHGFDPYYISLYNGNTNPSFSVGEYWTQDKQAIQNWIDATGSTAFDFPTYFALKGAIRDGNWSYLSFQGEASGGIGWDPQHYTTFIENHDTPDYDPTNNVLNGGNVGSAYAYLLTHPGVPTVFYSHFSDWGSSVKQEIKDLMTIRKSAGIHNQSDLTVHASSTGLYAASIEGNNGKVAVKLGYDNWSPSDAGLTGNWTLKASGNNYAVWMEGGNPPEPPATYEITIHTTDYTSAYAWDDNQSPLLGGWPGTGLTTGECWNSLTFFAASPCVNIILSDNGAGQTDDLNMCGEKYYYNNGFHDAPPASNPCEPEPPQPPGDGFTVYVQGYTTAYAWDDNQNPLLGGWPGATMTDEGNGWFSITIEGDCSNIIFSNNGNGQTADLYTCGGYYSNGTWLCDDPSTQTSATMYVQGYTTAYAWDDNQNPLLGGWPGTPMTNEGNGWFSATVPVACANIIFSNNGASQTDDLYSCGGTYTNGNWSCDIPGNNSRMNELSLTEIKIFPTVLTQGYFNLTIDSEKDMKSYIDVFNLQGQKIKGEQIQVYSGNNNYSIRMPSNISAGIYLVSIRVGDELFTEKVMIRE